MNTAQQAKLTRLRAAFPGRSGLGAYLDEPEAWPASRVIFHTPGHVAIHDLYPKSFVHCLLLARSPAARRLHPFDALDGSDPDFLAETRAQAARLRSLVAAELRRRLGRDSAAEAARNAVLDGEVEADAEGGPLPEGRDWEAEVRVGVHAVPSMDHLHIHVLSPDMAGASMKKKNHYLSFNTPFFVDLADFPLAPDDPRRQGGLMHPADRLICWRCHKEFGNKFEALKRHLAEEFEEWKKE
ncbi:hypothetical protein RB595_002614 [Gaeumannomyces hyphopodioides]